MRLRFHGDGGALFLIYIKYLLLSAVTLGIYSFWGRTSVRRYLWSQALLDGEPFTWHGTGGELLRGWLKAFLLFVPLVLQGALWEWALGSPWGGILGGLVFLAGFVVLLPAMIVGSWRYRMSRTSWRGIHFVFEGSFLQAAPMLVRDGLLTVLTLGLYTPWFLNHLRGFLTENTRYGTLRFRYDAVAANLFPPFLISLLLALPTLTLSRYYFQAVSFRHFWSGTAAGEGRFESSVRGMELFLVSATNFLLVVFTLGLGYPWARARLARYYCERLWLANAPDLSLVQPVGSEAGAAGQEMAHILDLDGLDFTLGF